MARIPSHSSAVIGVQGPVPAWDSDMTGIIRRRLLTGGWRCLTGQSPSPSSSQATAKRTYP